LVAKSVLQPPKKIKKKRPKFLDPDAPKRPVNAFMMYAEMHRENIKKERGETVPGSEEELALSNINKALGLRWKNLNEDEKKTYQDLFKEKVDQYNETVGKYILDNPNSIINQEEALSEIKLIKLKDKEIIKGGKEESQPVHILVNDDGLDELRFE
jgi:hypothetical protein